VTEASLPDRVRAACAWVAERARWVRIDEGEVAGYAARLFREPDPGQEAEHEPADREAAAAFAICMNAINFGSGWWPTIRKRRGHSGYETIAAGVRERFATAGPWTAEELTMIDTQAIAGVVGQDREHPLIPQFAAALRDLGSHLLAEHGGRYLDVVERDPSAPALAGRLAGWEAFADVSIYEEREVPFYKRAQLAVADLDRAGVVELADLDRLTAFADNLVPHVLRVDGILHLDPELTARIEAEELLVYGSPEEVELRACAVHAVELLAAATGGVLTPAAIDAALWNRGRDRRYKRVPRPRCRNTAY
jgi:Potential Queuosine, Q, salvage protein family